MLKLVVLISGSGSNLRALLEAASDDTYPAEIVAVGADNAAKLIQTGADVLVAGNFVFSSENPTKTILELKKL